MKIKNIICFCLSIQFIFMQANSNYIQENPDLHKIEVKEELKTWDDLYKRSIGVGFASSTPINNALINFNENMKSSNKLLTLSLQNYNHYDIDNNRLFFSLLFSTEQFYLINNLNIWQLIEYPYKDILKLGIGAGLTTVFYNLEFSEIAPGLLLDVNSKLPIQLESYSFIIGLRYKSIFSSLKDIPVQELQNNNISVFNFYLTIEYDIENINFLSLLNRI